MSARWLFAVVASLAVHAVILAVLLGWHWSEEKTEGPNAPAVEKIEDAVSKPMAEKKSDEAMLKPEMEDRTLLTPAPKVEDRHNAGQTPAPKVKPTPEAKPKAKPQKAPAPAKPTARQKGHKFTTYVVKPGDSLSSIAKSCGCTPAELAKINGKPYKAFAKMLVGQKIKIKVKEDSPADGELQ